MPSGEAAKVDRCAASCSANQDMAAAVLSAQEVSAKPAVVRTLRIASIVTTKLISGCPAQGTGKISGPPPPATTS
jgi:hypothetical protein